MNLTRRLLMLVFLCLTAMPALAETDWRVRDSEGLDAVLLIGILAGDELAGPIYEDEIADFRARLSPEALTEILALGELVRAGGGLTGPNLALHASAGPDSAIEDVIASFSDPEARLRPAMEASPYWNDQAWLDFTNKQAVLAVRALEALRAAGFSQWRRETYGAALKAAETDIYKSAAPYDMIGEQSRLLGRDLEPRIEIILAAFSQPYGIKIIGQRFLNHYSYDPSLHLSTAAHEMFHPPFDAEDWRLTARLAALEKDPWVRSIVQNHDPRFGYNSFPGLMDEDSAQALDQIVAERLSLPFARDPAERWASHDGGMHMLAAALYHAMKEDGFDQRGGIFEDWLKSALDRGLLTPEAVRHRAEAVVGDDAAAKWDSYAPVHP